MRISRTLCYAGFLLGSLLLIGCQGEEGDQSSSSVATSESSATSQSSSSAAPQVSSSLCEFIDGQTYFSNELLDGGATPNGETKIHWSVSFKDGEMTAEQADYLLAGQYTCQDDQLIATINGAESTMVFSDDGTQLTFDPDQQGDVVYVLAEEVSTGRCAEIAGERFVTPDYELVADPEMGPTFFEFDEVPNKVVFGYGDIREAGYYDCQYGGRHMLHIHLQGSDEPMLVEIGRHALYLTILDEHQTYLEIDPEGYNPCTLEYLPVCTRVEANEPCLADSCPTHYYKTFSNQCMADSEGALVIRQGECGDLEGQPYYDQTACIALYDPVCAKAQTNIQCIQAPCENYAYKTFGNDCEAGAAKAKFSFNGECSLLSMENQVAYEHQPTRLYHLDSGTSAPKEMPSSDDIQVIESSIDEDILTVKLGYSGCDVQPIYYNVDASTVLESLPEQIRFSFSKTREEACDAAFTETYQYDLLPVRANFRSIVEGENGLLILGIGGPLYKR